MSDESAHREQEYRQLREYVRQLRSNILEMDDLLEDMRWTAAGGRAPVNIERFERLVEANRRMCDDLEEMDIPDPWEVRDSDE